MNLHPYTRPPREANNPIADVFLLLNRPKIPPLPASSARLAEMAVSPGSGATMVNAVKVYAPDCYLSKRIEKKMDRRGGSLMKQDAPAVSPWDLRVIYSPSPQNSSQGRLAKFPRVYPHGGHLRSQFLSGPTGLTRSHTRFNQMPVRIAGISTERAEAPHVPAKNLVIDCRQWLH